jgi:hypothetical protein
MNLGEIFSITSHIINFLIFIYFAVVLIKINFLDVSGLMISAFGILMSLIANILSVLEK